MYKDPPVGGLKSVEVQTLLMRKLFSQKETEMEANPMVNDAEYHQNECIQRETMYS